MTKVLIVDDNFSDLELMKSILEDNSFEVAIATNGAQAVDLFHSVEFDLFLIDIKMPTLSGYDMVQLLREKKDGNSKIIFVSVVSKKDVELDKVNGFIQKPFSINNFINTINKVLGVK